VTSLRDGIVSMSLYPNIAPSDNDKPVPPEPPTNIDITFYDMPSLESTVLPDDYIGPRDRPYKIDKIDDRVGHMNTTLKGYFRGH
jgi:hypothetical protein